MTRLHVVGDEHRNDWSRRVNAPTPAELTTTQVKQLEELARWFVVLDEARGELRQGLESRDWSLAGRAARRLLAVGALFGDIASRMEAFER